MKLADFPNRIQRPWGWRAGASYIRAIPLPSQIGIVDGAASWSDGFPPKTFEPIKFGGVPPHGADHNGVLNHLSGWTRAVHTGAPLPYDAAFQVQLEGYPKGSLVVSLTTPGLIWESQVDDNVTNPDEGGAGWSVRRFVDPGGGGLIVEGANEGGIRLIGGGLAKTITTRDGDLVVLSDAGQPILTLHDDGSMEVAGGLGVGGDGDFVGMLTAAGLDVGNGPITGGPITGTSLTVAGSITALDLNATRDVNVARNVVAKGDITGQDLYFRNATGTGDTNVAGTIVGGTVDSNGDMSAVGTVRGSTVSGGTVRSDADVVAGNSVTAANEVRGNTVIAQTAVHSNGNVYAAVDVGAGRNVTGSYIASNGNIDAQGIITAVGARLRAAMGLGSGDPNAALLLMDLEAIIQQVLNRVPAVPPFPPVNPGEMFFSDNGWYRAPNGFMIQWGNAYNMAGVGATWLSFPMAFPNVCYSVVICEGNAGGPFAGGSWNENIGTLHGVAHIMPYGFISMVLDWDWTISQWWNYSPEPTFIGRQWIAVGA